MIFVTVGTHKDPFDRLIKKMDQLIEDGSLKENVVMQIGNATYEPKNCEYYRFVGADKFEELYKNADTIICHAGAGSIINALKNNKHLVVVPRLKKFHEHTDDHQLDLAEAMENAGKAICVRDINDMDASIKKAAASSGVPQSNTLEKKISEYLETVAVK
ncbi:MAG: beta-1,4-galactosyltransferase [Candidatus Aenigmarchaeota archaeon]|nr:beta-1,4-galactosyltransferase [Candidatus Aenigmarchaeota archaeon]